MNDDMTESNRKIVWITGASSGIGKAIAVEMASLGYQLILSGRNIEALKLVAQGTDAIILPFDVSNRAENLLAAKKIDELFGYVDMALFNAGSCEYIDVKSFNSKPFENMIQTNFLSMVYGVEAILPLLRKSKTPHLVGMSSSVAYLGLPRAEAYGASKAAVVNFLEGLRLSLSSEKIDVTIILPGFIKTPLTDKNDFPMPMRIEASIAAKIMVKKIAQKKFIIKVPFLFVSILQSLSFLPQKWRFHLLKRIS
jgi:short-subunit dehydrogenase